ncbi:MAG: hypothetical protein BJG00_010590 [Limnothrix sp. CACIAM 69d]|nr:MAG: hypothetical protein BJG00_010590 [Limnothrix sp. CACIAM 69d]
MKLIDCSMSLPSHATDLSNQDYLVLGLATCFLKEEGELQSVSLIEPIPSAALETILQGIPTSYQWAIALPIEAALAASAAGQLPEGFPPESHWCADFEPRAIAAARTYRSRPSAQQHIPIGQRRTDLNHSVDRKRVLNANSVVRPEDNVKQHAYTHQVL